MNKARLGKLYSRLGNTCSGRVHPRYWYLGLDVVVVFV